MRELTPHKVREMSAEEVRLKISDLQEEMFNLRFRNSMRQLDNPLKIREARRDMARLLTILKEHDLGLRTLGAGLAAKGGAKAAVEGEAGAAVKKTATKKAAKKTGGKKAAKKTGGKKTGGKKAGGKKTAVPKAVAKKPAVKKAAARKTTRKAPSGAGK